MEIKDEVLAALCELDGAEPDWKSAYRDLWKRYKALEPVAHCSDEPVEAGVLRAIREFECARVLRVHIGRDGDTSLFYHLNSLNNGFNYSIHKHSLSECFAELRRRLAGEVEVGDV